MSSAEDNLQEQRDEILALQSIYNTDDDQKVKTILETNEDSQGTTSILVSANVKSLHDQIRVHIVVPNEHDEPEQLGATAGTEKQQQPTFPDNVKVEMKRSISGRKWEGSFELRHLCPLLMHITFPCSYPSHKPPDYRLSCCWLTPLQIQALSNTLDQLWQDASSMPIVFTWMDWLENDALEHLGIGEHLTLHACQSDENLEMEDKASEDTRMPWKDKIGWTVASLIKHNRELVDIEFRQNQQVCEVCFDEKPGSQFFKLRECEHKFCHDCMMAFCELHVKEGTVTALRCPDTECQTLIPPHVVRAVLEPEAYDRWERLLLQKTLDAMADTVYCPRCQSLVISEEGEGLNLGLCTVCYFSFCTRCNESWHQGSKCLTNEELLKELENRENDPNQAEQEKRRRMKEEIASKDEVENRSTRCPRCNIPVERNGGCDTMTCSCGEYFCWLCGKAYDDEESCMHDCSIRAIVQDEGILRRERMRPNPVVAMGSTIVANPELETNQVRCPMCKQFNWKSGRNNHIKCWNCRCNFCFICNCKISGIVTDHFKGPCLHHS